MKATENKVVLLDGNGNFYTAGNPLPTSATMTVGSVAVDTTALETLIGPLNGAAVTTDSDGSLHSYLRGLIKLAITAGSFLVRGTVASGGIASGAISSGAVASGAVASGAVASGAVASGAVVDGAMVTVGALADGPAIATEDTTARSAISLLKGIKNTLYVNLLGVLGVTTGAAVITDTDGTVQQYLRGLVKLIAAKITVIADASENHIGNVDGFVASVEVIPTVDTAAYSAGDVVGGLMTFNTINRASGKGVVIQSLLLKDWANQKPAGALYLFNDNPSASTFADQAGLTIHANDRAKLKRAIIIASSDWTTCTVGGASVAFCDLQGKAGGIIIPAAQAIYGIFVTSGAPDFAAATDFSVSLGTLG